MGFWDTIKKVDKTLVTVGGTAAAVGVGVGAIASAKRKREMQEREMAMKEQNAAVDREYKMRKLEAEERQAMLKAETEIQKANIMYGEGRVTPSVIFDHDNGVMIDNRQPTPRQQMSNSAVTGQGSNASDVQQKILEAHEMLKSGIIDEDEFKQMKANILAGK